MVSKYDRRFFFFFGKLFLSKESFKFHNHFNLTDNYTAIGDNFFSKIINCAKSDANSEITAGKQASLAG